MLVFFPVDKSLRKDTGRGFARARSRELVKITSWLLDNTAQFDTRKLEETTAEGLFVPAGGRSNPARFFSTECLDGEGVLTAASLFLFLGEYPPSPLVEPPCRWWWPLEPLVDTLLLIGLRETSTTQGTPLPYV